MRTKTLLLSAVLGLASVAGSVADTFSVNAVGYINVAMAPGFNLVANQLTRSNNTLNAVFPSAPDESLVLTFANNVYTTDISLGGEWFNNDTAAPSTTTVEPGKGFFFFNPLPTTTNLTLVGEVPQGTNTVSLPPGFKIASTVVPQSISLLASNSFPQIDEMLFLTFANNTYTTLINLGGEWFNNETAAPADAKPAVGQGYFIFNPLPGSTNWTRAFSVNN